MYNLSPKYKRFLLSLIKLIIIIGAFYYSYEKLSSNHLLSISQLKSQFTNVFFNNIWTFIFILLLTDANWLLEILKWKTLASIEKKITFFDAYEQCFSSLTVSLITPNRIGEYGAKALYYKNEIRKKIMFLNLIGNLNQLGVTIFFGLIGVVFLIRNFNFKIPITNNLKLLWIPLIIGILFFFKRRIDHSKIKNYLKKLSLKFYSKIILLSFLRYLFFTHQFIFLLRLFNVETNYFSLLYLTFCMYLLASIIPTLAFFDWLIKGSVAIWVFGYIELNELTVVTVTTIMWILNFAIPSIIGSIFVLNFKTIQQP